MNDTEFQVAEANAAREKAAREEQERENAWLEERTKRQNAILFDVVNNLRQNKQYAAYDVVSISGSHYDSDATLEHGDTTIEIQVRVRKTGESRY